MEQFVSGVVPLSKRDLDSKINAIQTLVAVRQNHEWRITLFQTSHGKPKLVQAITDEPGEMS